MRFFTVAAVCAALVSLYASISPAQVPTVEGSPATTQSSTTAPTEATPGDAAPAAAATPPVRFAAAFPVAPDLLVTAASAVNGAGKFELTSSDGTTETATLMRVDADTGLALIRLASRKMHFLALASDFQGGELQCSAFTSADIFNPTPEPIKGSASVESGKLRLSLTKLPHSPGGPLIVDGKVVGVELADRDSDPDRLPCVTLKQLKAFLKTDVATTGATGGAVDATLQLTATKSD